MKLLVNMKESIRRLLESKNYEDVCLGFSLWYNEIGDSYFKDLMTEYADTEGKHSDVMKTPFECKIDYVLIKTPGNYIIHLLGNNCWCISEYKSEIGDIKSPKYNGFIVYEL